VVIPLVNSDGEANLLDVPRHHLEAFVRGGPMTDATRHRAVVGDVIMVDGRDYF
jgi:hypothetical protein